MNRRNKLAFVAIGFCLSLVSSRTPATEVISFSKDIAPIFQEYCVACHGAKKAEGGYRIDTFSDLIKVGDSEQTPIAAKDPHASELLRRLTTSDESERMPAESEPLSAEQIKLISDWIAAGAAFDGSDESALLAFVIPAPQYSPPPDKYNVNIPLTAVAFSPDGSQILAGGYHEITVWNAADAKLVRRIQNIGQRVFAIAMSPDGKTLAVACGEPGRSGEVRLIDFTTGEVKGVVGRSTDVALDVAYRPHSDELAIASADQSIRIVNSKTQEVVRTLSSHADWVTAIAWSDDGKRLVAASRDKSAKVFERETGQMLVSYQGHGAAVRGVAFTPDALQVLSVGTDNKLHRWNVQDAKKVAEVGIGGEGYRVVRGDGFVLIPCSDRRLLKFDLASNKIAQEFKGHEDWVLSVAMHAADSRIVSGAFNGEVRLWNLDGNLIKNWIARP